MQIRQKSFLKDYFRDFLGTSFIPASSATTQVPLCGSMLGLNPEAEFMNSRTYKFVEVSGHNLVILRVLRLEVSVFNVYITNQF